MPMGFSEMRNIASGADRIFSWYERFHQDVKTHQTEPK